MRRLITIAPLALFTTACGGSMRSPATPAMVLSDAGDRAFPDPGRTTLPAEADALASWQLPPSSPWSRYVKLTLLTYLADTPMDANMPEVRRLDEVARAEEAAARVAATGLPGDMLWIVDLRGAASVAFGATLSRKLPGAVAPVPTFNNWPAEAEVIPAEQTLAAMVTLRPIAPARLEAEAAPVFLLDAFRLAYRDDEPDPELYDNRYALLASDFPDAAALAAQGIRRVVYVVEDASLAGTEEDDLHELFLAYQSAGISVGFVDLAWLARLGDTAAWSTWADTCAVRIWPRATVFDDPEFYVRARGGFGWGIQATPSHRVHVGTGAHGGRSHTPARPGVRRVYSGATPHVGGGKGFRSGG